jgi:hypothetical protein
MRFSYFFLSFICLYHCGLLLMAQDDDFDYGDSRIIGQEKSYNPINTAVPFLMIAPDSRAAGMGDAGVATSPDASSMHWNPAKYAFVENQFSAVVSFTPWLKNLVDDMYVGHLAGYYRVDNMQVVGFSLKYFNLGSITFTDNWGNKMRDYNPHEFSLDIAYARLFGDRVSGSVAFRYVYSNLTGSYSNTGSDSKPGQSYAADVSLYYKNDEISISDKDAIYTFGLNVSNIGTKISYTAERNEFIPINLRLGSGLTFLLDRYNEITFTVDLNKLLVPTPPEYNGDSIAYGMDRNVAVPAGMLQSFYDAPGIAREDGSRSVLREELQEIIYSFGLEYWYNKQFAVRAGYFHEHERKGNRKYFTVGLGLRYNILGLDFAYLVPTYFNNNPLANTVRFSLSFDLDQYAP